MCTLKTLLVAAMIIVLMRDAYASGMPVPGRGIAFRRKARRRSSQFTATPVEAPLNIVLDAYPRLSVRLRAFLEAQITGRKDYSKRLDAALIYELLLYRDQWSSIQLRGLVSLIKSMELWESDLAPFEKIGEDRAYFTQLKTLRLFCSGLTPETFPDLSALPLTRLELWFYSPELPPAGKLPKTLVKITLNEKEFMRE